MQRENNSIELTCVLVVEKQDDSWLWHQKFGHLNYPTLYEYSSNGRIIGLPKLAKHLKICSDYLITKKVERTFPSKVRIKEEMF
jgi:hypothetical protein